MATALQHVATNPYKLFVNHCRINARKHFFSERIIKVWNSLPPSIVSVKSLSLFRRSLNNVNLGIYTKYVSFIIVVSSYILTFNSVCNSFMYMCGM